MGFSHILSVLCLFFCLSGPWRADAQKINGLSFVASRDSVKPVHVQSVRNMNANWTALMPFSVLPNLQSPQLWFEQDRQWYGETLAGVRQYYRALKARGIESMIKPQIWVRDGSFSGHIKMQSEADWLAFEQRYREFILPFAKLAQQEGVGVFCIGTELKDFVRARPNFWNKLIVEIREIYKGKLTYAANWDEYAETPFWPALDYIGVDAYFPLTEVRDPTAATLKAAWAPYVRDLKNMAMSCNKKVLFTEYGYRSVDYVGARPWRIDRNQQPVNLEAQSRALENIVHEFWPQDWFAGGFVWKWFMHLESAGGPEDNRYTPQNKPAASVLARAYAKYL